MKTFIQEDFLLQSKQAVRLYHEYAAGLPILDYHNHISPRAIAGNKNFRNLTEAWLENDQYKWRLMRTMGIDEQYITGDADDQEKFEKWAYTVPYAVRNPLYHWTHLELQRYFGIDDLLSPATGLPIYEKASELLKSPAYSTQSLLKKMNVEVICTPSDPADDLKVHEKIAEHNVGVKVLPTWRPERLFEIEHILSFNEYMDKLSEASGVHIVSLQDLVKALQIRHDYFSDHGCVVADHYLDTFYSMNYTLEEVQAIFAHSRLHKPLSWEEVYTFRSYILRQMAVMNHAKGWIQQYHYGAMRNNNTRMYDSIGADMGWDSVGDQNVATRMVRFLDSLDKEDQLAKTILYNLNPSDNAVLASMLGNFNDGSIKGKVQFGSAWRFNNHKEGIEAHLNMLSNMSLLSVFAGTQTDSHSFLSFPRHEYFRRVLCNLVGHDMVKGELPEDYDLLGKVIQDISYFNAKNYFNF